MTGTVRPLKRASPWPTSGVTNKILDDGCWKAYNPANSPRLPVLAGPFPPSSPKACQVLAGPFPPSSSRSKHACHRCGKNSERPCPELSVPRGRDLVAGRLDDQLARVVLVEEDVVDGCPPTRQLCVGLDRVVPGIQLPSPAPPRGPRCPARPCRSTRRRSVIWRPSRVSMALKRTWNMESSSGQEGWLEGVAGCSAEASLRMRWAQCSVMAVSAAGLKMRRAQCRDGLEGHGGCV